MPFALHQASVLCLVVVPILNIKKLLIAPFNIIHQLTSCQLLFSHYHFYNPVNHVSSSLKGLILLCLVVECFFNELLISSLLESFLILLSHVNFVFLKTLAIASPFEKWVMSVFFSVILQILM